jgi:hypothetical protein
MKAFYEKARKNVFDFVPLTFHIKAGVNDPAFVEFARY